MAIGPAGVAGSVRYRHLVGAAGGGTGGGLGQLGGHELHVPAAVAADSAGVGVAVPGHRDLGARFGVAGEVHAVPCLGGGDDVVATVQLDVGGLGRCRLVHGEGAGGRSRAAGWRGHGGRQRVLAVGDAGGWCRHFPVAVGVGGGRHLVGAEGQLHFRAGLGRALQLHAGSRLGGIDDVVVGNVADDGGGAVGVQRDRRRGGRTAVAGRVDGGGRQRVLAVGGRQFSGRQRGVPLALGIHGHQLGGAAELEFDRAVGFGRAGNRHTRRLLGGGDDVVTAYRSDLGAGRRGVVIGERHHGQRGTLHAIQCAGHFQRVAVRQAAGRQVAGGGLGRLQVHAPVAVGVGRGGVGDVLALVVVGVQAQRHHGAGLGRAGNGGEAVVERGGRLQRQRYVAQVGGAGGITAATAAAGGQGHHGQAACTVQHGTDGEFLGGRLLGGLEAGVVQHEGAVRERAQGLGAHVCQHRGLAVLGGAQILLAFGTLGDGGVFTAHADRATVGGAAHLVVAFQRHRGRLGAAFHRDVLDDQVVVHLQHAKLGRIDRLAVRILQVEGAPGHDPELVVAGLELELLDPAVTRALDVQSCCHDPVFRPVV